MKNRASDSQSSWRRSATNWLIWLLILLLGLALAGLGYLLVRRTQWVDASHTEQTSSFDDELPPTVSSDDCLPFSSISFFPSMEDKENLIYWLREGLNANPEGGSGDQPNPVFAGTDHESVVGSTTNGNIAIDATIQVRGGVLSLLPPARQAELLAKVGSPALQSAVSSLPILIVTDATGLGGGWHMTTRFEEAESPEEKMICWALVLPQEEIIRIYGNENPESRMINPSRLSAQDQLVLSAKPNHGMGMYLTAPSLISLSAAQDPRITNSTPMVVCLIAGPL